MNMNDKQIDELINKALRDDLSLPEGVSERLEQQIDAWAAMDRKKTARPTIRKRSLYWLSAAAAVALLCIGSFHLYIQDTGYSEHRLADTYTDPQEAAAAAQKALLLLSQNLNKGLDQMNDARQEMNKVNKILNKHFND